MIEVIYKEEKQKPENEEGLFSIPRNIRQIGLISGNYRIYIEDYVYTFLGRLAGGENKKEKEYGSIAVLTGDTKWENGISYLFIRGALMVENTQANPDHIDFSEKVWSQIHEDKEKYFSDQNIVGWFFAKEQLPVQMTEFLTKVHLRHFGAEKVLMLMEPLEKEDAFFCYESGFMVRQRGYYIYYEKNPAMQEYMIEKNRELTPQLTEEVEDEAVKTFRRIIRGKNGRKNGEEAQETEGHTSVFSYAATACPVIAVLAVGTNFYRNYQDMRSVGEDAGMTAAVVLKDTEMERGEGEKSESESVAGRRSVTPAMDITATPVPVITVTPTPVITATPMPTPMPTPVSVSGETSSENVYLEESDARKAKRREALSALENAEQGEAQTEVQSETETAAAGIIHETYVIRPGDTLYQISIEQYGSMDEISEICRLNGLSENEIIYPGQVIVLP